MLLVLVAVGVISVWRGAPRRGGEAPGRDSPRWLPVARGSVEFVGETSEFRVLRKAPEAVFRFEDEDGAALESARLDDVTQMFVRHKLVGLRPREALRFRVSIEPGLARPAGAGRDRPLDWPIEIEPETQRGETWYRTLRGTTGEPLYARSIEELKEKIARELARDVVAFHSGEIAP